MASHCTPMWMCETGAGCRFGVFWVRDEHADSRLSCDFRSVLVKFQKAKL